MVLGAGGIRAINPSKSAFGQTALSDITAENKWLYFRPNGTGALQWADITGGQSVEDPTLYGTSTNNPYRIQTTSENVRSDGFSQAYSPATQNSLGIYGVVPLHINIQQRNSAGDTEAADLGIYASWEWGANQSVAVGFEMQVQIRATNTEVDDINTQAQETRRALASTFDDSGLFKLGSAITDCP